MDAIKTQTTYKKKRLKYGSFTVFTAAGFIAFLIILNLTAGALKFKIDLSEDNMFSLSEQTVKMLRELQEEVKIFGIYESGKEDLRTVEILDSYDGKSRKLSVQYMDPVLYPQFEKKYVKNGEKLKQGSIIVESGSKFKVIDPAKFVNRMELEDGTKIPESLAVEQRVTSAVMYVTSKKNPAVYSLQGHGESALGEKVKNALDIDNFTVTDLDLSRDNWQPQKEDILLIVSPKKDITKEEADKLREFLGRGGRGVFLLDLVKEETPNMQELLKSYGIGMKKAIAVEGDIQYAYSAQNPLYLLPGLGKHLVVESLVSSNLRAVIPGANPIEILELKRSTLMLEPFMTTSSKSYSKKDLTLKTINKESGDVSGPFNLGVVILDRLDTEDTTNNPRLVVVSNSFFLDDEAIEMSRGANLDLFINSLNWVQDKKQSLNIESKNLLTYNLRISEEAKFLYSGFVVLIIPASVAAMGIVIWLRRRHL